MPAHDIIVVGASAGGVEALTDLASSLPADLPAAIFVVLHFPSDGTSVLPDILNRAGPLHAAHAQNGQRIEPGRIVVAPPDHHLLLKHGSVRLVRGPRENSHRPAIDPLFRSAARAYGPCVIGVVLSGTLDDGTVGLQVVKSRGGIAIVQEPGDALYAGMPSSAIEHVNVDYVLPVSQIGGILSELARTPVEEGEEPVSSEDTPIEMEVDASEMEGDAFAVAEMEGDPSVFTCPECHGTLWEIKDGQMFRYRCRVGHAYSPDSLVAEQAAEMEAALWTAFRALKETAGLAHTLATRAKRRHHTISARRFEQQARDSEERAALIRRVLLKDQSVGVSEDVPEVEAETGEVGTG